MTALIDNYTSNHQLYQYNLTSTVLLERKYEHNVPHSLTVSYQMTEGDILYNRHQNIIDAMETLGPNWDGDGALPPDNEALMIAKSITYMLWRYGQPVYHIAPGPVGEVMVNLRNGDKSLELLFYPNRWKYVQFSPHEAPRQGNLDFLIFPELLTWLNK